MNSQIQVKAWRSLSIHLANTRSMAKDSTQKSEYTYQGLLLPSLFKQHPLKFSFALMDLHVHHSLGPKLVCITLPIVKDKLSANLFIEDDKAIKIITYNFKNKGTNTHLFDPFYLSRV